MKKILFAVLILSYVSFAQSGIYSIEADVTIDDTAVLKNISAGYGLPSNFPTIETGYMIKVLSNSNAELFSANLGVSFNIISDPPMNVQLDEVTVHARVPVFPAAKYVAIYHDDKKIMNVNLETICNKNGICNVGENIYNCKDCLSGGNDGYCDKIFDSICDRDCSLLDDADCYSGGIIVIVLIPVIIILYRMHQKKKMDRIIERVR